MRLRNSGAAQAPDVLPFGLIISFTTKASEKIKCDDRDIFDGNCFENPHQLYLRWNMRDNNGRRVGVGAYVAHIKVRVYGAKESFKVERFYNWGITGSRKIRSKD